MNLLQHTIQHTKTNNKQCILTQRRQNWSYMDRITVHCSCHQATLVTLEWPSTPSGQQTVHEAAHCQGRAFNANVDFVVHVITLEWRPPSGCMEMHCVRFWRLLKTLFLVKLLMSFNCLILFLIDILSCSSVLTCTRNPWWVWKDMITDNCDMSQQH